MLRTICLVSRNLPLRSNFTLINRPFCTSKPTKYIQFEDVFNFENKANNKLGPGVHISKEPLNSYIDNHLIFDVKSAFELYKGVHKFTEVRLPAEEEFASNRSTNSDEKLEIKYDNQYHAYRSNGIVIGNKMGLFDEKSIAFLKEGGMDFSDEKVLQFFMVNAIAQNRIDQLKYFLSLSNGSYLDLRSEWGFLNLLEMAIHHNKTSMYFYLKELGCTLPTYSSAKEYAVRNNSMVILRDLLEGSPKKTFLEVASFYGGIKMMKALIKEGLEVDTSILNIAIYGKYEESISYLIENHLYKIKIDEIDFIWPATHSSPDIIVKVLESIPIKEAVSLLPKLLDLMEVAVRNNPKYDFLIEKIPSTVEYIIRGSGPDLEVFKKRFDEIMAYSKAHPCGTYRFDDIVHYMSPPPYEQCCLDVSKRLQPEPFLV